MKKKRDERTRQVPVFGAHTVTALLQHHPERVVALDLQQGRRMPGIAETAEQHGIPVHYHPRATLDNFYPDTTHQGVVAHVKPAAPQNEQALDEILSRASNALVLVLDGIQDPHNLGACLRTAEAAGVHALVAPRDRAVGLSPAARKVASGAAELVPFVQVTNLARTLKRLQQSGLWLVGTAGDAPASLYQAGLAGPAALVMGAEGGGLRRLTREQCDEVVHIPMPGRIASLNVSVATGVCLFEALRQRMTDHNNR